MDVSAKFFRVWVTHIVEVVSDMRMGEIQVEFKLAVCAGGPRAYATVPPAPGGQPGRQWGLNCADRRIVGHVTFGRNDQSA